MELANALYKIDMLVDDQGRTGEKEAWNFIRAYIAEVQKPAHNNARDEMPACEQCKGFSQSCGFGSFRGCSGCKEARQALSPVA